MTIRMVDLAATHRCTARAAEDAVLDVLRSGQYFDGTWIARAEGVAARWFGRTASVGVASGTDALILALQALGIGPGDEVIVPAVSFFATAGAVAATGALPRFVDVDERGLLDPAGTARAITDHTRAVVPVHLYGNLAPAPDLGVPVIDDAAQAIGGEPAPSLGVLTVLSAYPTKTWGAAGNAGFVLGDDPELLQRVRELSVHGHRAGSFFRVLGHLGRNARLDAVQAAVLAARAEDLPRQLARRRAIASRYDAGLPRAIRPVPRDPGSPVQQYVVRTPHRDRLAAHLSRAGIESRVYYPLPLPREPAFAEQGAFPGADRFCAEVLALPVHSELADEDVDRILEVLSDFS